MALATKNGALIVKDGVIASTCRCCGGSSPCRECCTNPTLPDELSARLIVDEATVCYVDRFLFGGTLFFCARLAQFVIDETVSLVLVQNSSSCAEWLHDTCDGTTRIQIRVVLTRSGAACSWSASWTFQKCAGNGVFTAGGLDVCCDGRKGFVIAPTGSSPGSTQVASSSIALPILLNQCEGQATASGNVVVGFDCSDSLQQSLGAVCLAQEQCGGDSNINSSQCNSVVTPWSLEVTI